MDYKRKSKEFLNELFIENPLKKKKPITLLGPSMRDFVDNSNVKVRGPMSSLFLIGHLSLSGIWQGIV